MKSQINEDEIEIKYDKIAEYYKNYKDILLEIHIFYMYKTRSKMIQRHIKTLIKLITEELCYIPQTFNEALKNMCTFNCVNDLIQYLDNLLYVTENVKKAYNILLALIYIDVQKDNFNYSDSLLEESYHFHCLNVSRVMHEKGWTDEYKYEDLHNFKNGLTIDKRGELIVQEFFNNKKFGSPVMTLGEKLSNRISEIYYKHYERSRMKRLTINSYIDEYGCILESDFAKRNIKKR